MNKKLLITMAVALMAAIALVAAAVMYQSIAVDATVTEGLELQTPNTISADFAGFPGEEKCSTITVLNKASVALDTDVSWVETDADGVDYTIDIVPTRTETIAAGPGVTTDFDVCLTFDTGTNPGTVTGNIELTRV